MPLIFSTGIAAQTLTVTQPDGVGDVVAEGRDFALYELGNRWDMAQSGDIVLTESGNVLNELIPSGTNSYIATSATFDPGFWLVYPGINGTNSLDNGIEFPINPLLYSKVAIKIRHDSAQNQFLQTIFFQDLSTFGFSNFKTVAPGDWSVVVIDLNSDIEGSSPNTWTSFAQVSGFRIDPVASSGVEFEIDWIRLVAPDSGATPSSYNVTWTSSGLSGQSITVLAVDSDGIEIVLATGLNVAAGAGIVDTAVLPSGDFTLRLRASGGLTDDSPGMLSINDAPNALLSNPDRSGDQDNDFATVVLANPWGPFDVMDFVPTDVTNESFSMPVGSYSAESTSGDSGLTFTISQPIDTSIYRMLTIDFELQGPRDLSTPQGGSVFRVFWGPSSMNVFGTDDFIVQEGRNTYRLGDLRDVRLEGAGVDFFWQGQFSHFRFDPHEFSPMFNDLSQRRFTLYSISLAPLDSADPQFEFTWTDSDADDNATLAIYYDVDRQFGNGNETLIQAGLSEDDVDDSFMWTAVNIPDGEYHIYIEATDGLNTVGHYATGPLRIQATTELPIFANGFEP